MHTLTWDNSSEFAEDVVIDIRKRRDLGVFTDETTNKIEDKLNQRRRKRLGFRTPQHLFGRPRKRYALSS
ncbi:MAG: hypothetical protein ABI082_05985 [Dokdonella sp.]